MEEKEDIKALWPLFSLPQNDELLSCWMVRNAHNHKQKIYTFYRKYLNPTKSKIWVIDSDRSPREDLVNLMSKGTGLSKDEIIQTTLMSFDGKLFEAIHAYGNTKWILPVGHYHTQTTRNSLMYCPGCLSTDETPFFRKTWRLSISFCCPDCKMYLRECCWNCGAAVNFIRTELGRKNEFNLNHLTYCHNCHEDLRSARGSICIPEDIVLQNSFKSLMSNGHSRTLNYSHLYFEALYQVCAVMLSNRPRALNLQRHVANATNVFYKPILDGRERSFDYIDSKRRRDVLTMAAWALEDWPHRFLNVMRNSRTGVFIPFLNRQKSNLPFWYASINYPSPFTIGPG